MKKQDRSSFGVDWSEMPGIPLADLHRIRDEVRQHSSELIEVATKIAVFRGDISHFKATFKDAGPVLGRLPKYRGLSALKFGGSWVVEFGRFLIFGRPESVRLLIDTGTPSGDITVPGFDYEQRAWLAARGIVFEEDGKGGVDEMK